MDVIVFSSIVESMVNTNNNHAIIKNCVGKNNHGIKLNLFILR